MSLLLELGALALAVGWVGALVLQWRLSSV